MSITSLLRRRSVQALLAAGVVVAVVALALFQPWKLVVDDTVDEAAPPGIEELTVPPEQPTPAAPTDTAAPVEPVTEPTATPAPTTAAQPDPARPRLLAAGTFISHEHESSGRVRVIALPDGKRILRLDDLRTSNGPDLHVWITDAPVLQGRDGWFVFDDGAHVDLGTLKGNQGSQNYELPASVDLAKLTSVTIWCDRFNVSFAAAPLVRT